MSEENYEGTISNKLKRIRLNQHSAVQCNTCVVRYMAYGIRYTVYGKLHMV